MSCEAFDRQCHFFPFLKREVAGSLLRCGLVKTLVQAIRFLILFDRLQEVERVIAFREDSPDESFLPRVRNQLDGKGSCRVVSALDSELPFIAIGKDTLCEDAAVFIHKLNLALRTEL